MVVQYFLYDKIGDDLLKKCDYCGKELESYHLMYCKDSDCEERAMRFYDRRTATENVFGIINIACVVLIMVGLIVAVFSPVVGNIMVAVTLVVLAITILIMPYAPESFYKKWRIKKTSRVVRIVGVILIAAAFAFAGAAIYYSTR